MFRACLGPSSRGTTVCMQQLYLLFFLDDCLMCRLDCSNPTCTIVTTASVFKKYKYKRPWHILLLFILTSISLLPLRKYLLIFVRGTVLLFVLERAVHTFSAINVFFNKTSPPQITIRCATWFKFFKSYIPFH